MLPRDISPLDLSSSEKKIVMLVINLILSLSLLALSEGLAIDRLLDREYQGSAPNEIIATSDVPAVPFENLDDLIINTLGEELSNMGTGISPEARSKQLDYTATSQDTYKISGLETTIDEVFCHMSQHPALVSCHSEVYADALKNNDPHNEYFKEPAVQFLRRDCFLADDIGFDMATFGLCCPLQKDKIFGFPCVPVVL